MTASGSGLFDPTLEKDSCGVGFIADIKGRKSHKIIEDALTILLNLEHRGAVGADPRAGDGAGIGSLDDLPKQDAGEHNYQPEHDSLNGRIHLGTPV